jgi:hypothetical protein
MLVYGFESNLPDAHDRAAHARTAFHAFSDQVFIARVEDVDSRTPGLAFVAGWVRQGDDWRPASPPHVRLELREFVLEAEADEDGSEFTASAARCGTAARDAARPAR